MYSDAENLGVGIGKSLGRWQAPDKGEVRPTPAFRLLRVGAELCVIESRSAGLSG